MSLSRVEKRDKKGMDPLRIQVVRFDGDRGKSIQMIRSRVFSGEQNVDPAIDFDGRDPGAVHVLAIKDGAAVGTGRMLDDGHLGRIAVVREARGLGIGEQVVLALIKEASQRRISRVFLGAQEHAVGFYEKLGFLTYGSSFEEAGIVHVHMEKYLDMR
ncbi:GNAT family N-acetyltransferase [Desulfospira joergensenii]|uniref:GNAT family N-acetyltransferase n=1 Tax=Desulfospira joergensenii TaxID=53329 RepID=UPI0003B62A1F|nr:GNAT family N-acetyltransferase [Desulfospira joergensenii]